MPHNNPQNLKPEEYRGTRRPEVWLPYKLWNGDMWECPDCQAQIVVGCLGGPVAYHHDDNFTELCNSYAASLQVNDC